MAVEPKRISVVIPAAGSAPLLGLVLEAVEAADPGPGEVIVVDDGLNEDAFAASKYASVKVIPNRPGFKGPASARNTGAAAAKGSIICFIDADVIVRPDFFGRLVTYFVGNVDGVVALQSTEMGYADWASTYKNLWMRYTYERLDGPVALFYTSAAAIRRSVFERTGGFDENYRGPSVEDTAFGRELARVGARIIVAKELEVEHRKRYTTGQVLRLAFRRGAELARLMLRLGSGQGNRSSVPTGYILSMPLAAALPAWLAVYFFAPEPAAVGFVVHLLFLYLFNFEWQVYLARGGVFQVLYGMLIMPFEMAFGFWGGVWGILSYLAGEKY
ncbi:MAG: glycosyltransferase family 2 protein [Candidatus Coatesbacteria bacterium]|nr:MAG: glycosyltransferase family 2 protein [Candidatus Coatesbacteria bacterium]